MCKKIYNQNLLKTFEHIEKALIEILGWRKWFCPSSLKSKHSNLKQMRVARFLTKYYLD